MKSEVMGRILEFCHEPRKFTEIMILVGYKDKKHFKEILNTLMSKGLIVRTYPDTPNHPNQKYVTVQKEPK